MKHCFLSTPNSTWFIWETNTSLEAMHLLLQELKRQFSGHSFRDTFIDSVTFFIIKISFLHKAISDGQGSGASPKCSYLLLDLWIHISAYIFRYIHSAIKCQSICFAKENAIYIFIKVDGPRWMALEKATNIVKC